MKNVKTNVGSFATAKLQVIIAIAMITVIGTILAGCASMTVVGVDNDATTGPKQVRQYETINPNDVTVYAFYKDESRKAVSKKSIVGFDSSKVGLQTVTVKLARGFTSTFETEVMALTGITVTAQPRAVKLGISVDNKWPGLEIQGTWDGMGTAKIDNVKCQITGIDINRAGVHTVTVAYKEKQTAFNTEVVALESIRITSNPKKVTYNQGENLDTTGLKVVGVWPILGAQEIYGIHTGSDGGISGYNSQTIGKQTITITYMGKTATFTVEVVQTLEGTWVANNVGTKYTFNNGNWQMYANTNQLIGLGTYTTNNWKITMTTTHFYTGGAALGIPAKLYTRNELETALRAAGKTQEAIDKMQLVRNFSTTTSSYFFYGGTLDIMQEGGQRQSFTKR